MPGARVRLRRAAGRPGSTCVVERQSNGQRSHPNSLHLLPLDQPPDVDTSRSKKLISAFDLAVVPSAQVVIFGHHDLHVFDTDFKVAVRIRGAVGCRAVVRLICCRRIV